MGSEDALRATVLLAHSYRLGGQREKALAEVNKLLQDHPKNGEIRELWATLLHDSNAPKTLAKAIQAWRSVAQGSQPGSDRWFRAKLAIAGCYFETGQLEQARELIQLTKTLHPKLGGEKLKLEFDRLLQKVERVIRNKKQEN